MSLRELSARPAGWMNGEGPQADVVLSSRVRLARDLKGVPFPNRADDVARTRLFRRVTEACKDLPGLERASTWNLDELRTTDREVFVERHLVSRDLAAGTGARGLVVSEDETHSVMVNEEDHLRIQSVTPGLNPAYSLERAAAMDRALEERLEYAVDDRLGYLTACPSNVGTGLRASVLIHLPALVLAGEVRKVHRAVGGMGLAVRGWFGEGSAALGDFYQLSNQQTLGRTEEEIVARLTRIAERVLELESKARERLRDDPARRLRLEDRVFRSWGTLLHARLLSVEQLMSCASDLRLGRWLGVLDVPPDRLTRLAFFGQRGHLGARCGKALDGDEEARERAEWVRSELSAST
jgi:protein arginine kinase